MDIERLKELKDYLRVANELSILNDDNLMQRIVDNNDVTNTIDIAIELLRSEIARQSVTDEAVRDAIYALEDKVWQAWECGYPITLGDRNVETMLTALRQMRTSEPDVFEPCEWCDITGDWIYEVAVIRNRRKTHKGEMKNYCPNCGRKLVKQDG